jgi:hypothetical protein
MLNDESGSGDEKSTILTGNAVASSFPVEFPTALPVSAVSRATRLVQQVARYGTVEPSRL